MNKISVVYWSGTGNTEAMANAIAEGIKEGNSDTKLLNVANATVEDIKNSDAIALGCPSMGQEVLEESEMEPFMESIEGIISGKKIILFGSYGWGDGEWMRNWVQRVEDCGGVLLEDEGFIVNNEPSAEDIEKCKELGRMMLNA